jgi:2-keto-3-deoxy-L-rhamnonate aldolase RhmA
VLLVVIIESAQGVANAEAIVAVDGIDGVIIGPFDLSTDLGHPGDFSHPSYAQALERIERATRAHSKLLGTGPHPPFTLENLVGRGHQLLLIGGDVALIREGLTAQLSKAQASLHAQTTPRIASENTT